MVVIDTSVFVRLHRQRKSELGQQITDIVVRNEACICGPVWVEFVGGFRSPTRRSSSIDRLRAFRWLDTNAEAYELAAILFSDHRAIGPMDAIIAATAAAHGAGVMTADKGFLSLRHAGIKIILVE